jgi:tetratricopeptide (TPR) repeat protein
VSVLSPAGVPRSLLHAAAESGSLPGCGGTRGVDEAVGRLAAGSLLTFSGDGGSVAAHRLVMRVVRERARHEDALAPLGLEACGLLTTVMESLGEPWKNRPAARDLIGQVMALHQNLSPCLDSSPGLAADLLELRVDTLDELIQLGDAVGLAVTIGRSVAADCERLLGKDHPTVPRCQNNLALAYRKAGRPDEAIPMYETILTEWKRTLGATHSTTLICQNNLATAYRAAGRPEDAIPLLEATLTSYERTPGATRVNTLTFRNNLATAYQEAGRLGDAIPLLEATATDCERALGATHPATLMCQNNLASAWLAAGRPANAIPLLEAILTDSRRILGATHPSTLMCQNNLAAAYRAAGHIDQALPLFETTLADSERVLGTTHPQTLMARKNLMSTYEELWLFAVWGEPEDGTDEDNAGGTA